MTVIGTPNGAVDDAAQLVRKKPVSQYIRPQQGAKELLFGNKLLALKTQYARPLLETSGST
jgi:hypothetical protein